MSRFIFGELGFKRGSIPAALTDLDSWPSVDSTALTPDARKDFDSRSEAIRLFVCELNVPLSAIETRTGLQRRQLYRQLQRCLEKHPDGRIMGFRALVPFRRVKPYIRSASAEGRVDKSGSAGAFSQLLARYPELEKWIKREARRHATPTEGKREVRRRLSLVHKNFVQRCRELGIQAHQYPLNADRVGIRSLATFLKRFGSSTFEKAAADAGATHVGRAWPADVALVKTPAVKPFESAEFDGHRIDLRITVRVIDPFGLELVYEIERIWILVLLDVVTRAALGYSLALGGGYSKEEVIDAFRAALLPHQPRELKIPGLSYSSRGGMPSAVCPETQYACWDWLRLDNAVAHLAPETLNRAIETIGCWPDFGVPGEPDSRPFIERFFSLIAMHFAHRLTGTTGSKPDDIRRALADPGPDLRLLLRLDELEDLIDVIVCDYNGDAHDGLGGRTPLEAMKHHLAKQPGMLRTLARRRRDSVTLLQECLILPVKGSLTRGVRPHVNFYGARYSSDILSANPTLIGTNLRVYFQHKDLRYLRAYFENGDELGVLMAARPWCFTAHSLKTRRKILRMKAQGKLNYREGDDAVEAFAKVMRKRAPKSRRAATDVAQLSRSAGAKPPEPRTSEAAEPIEHAVQTHLRDVTNGSDKPATPVVKVLRIRKAVII